MLRTSLFLTIFSPGLELWRGYFQSIRPAFNRMLINVDISTATMYKPGPLINLALEFFDRPSNNPNALAPANGLPDRERLRLQRFITGIRVLTPTPDGHQITRIIKKLDSAGASALSFKLREGGSMTVADYFKNLGSPLQHPGVLCVEVTFAFADFIAFNLKCFFIRSGLAR